MFAVVHPVGGGVFVLFFWLFRKGHFASNFYLDDRSRNFRIVLCPSPFGPSFEALVPL